MRFPLLRHAHPSPGCLYLTLLLTLPCPVTPESLKHIYSHKFQC